MIKNLALEQEIEGIKARSEKRTHEYKKNADVLSQVNYMLQWAAVKPLIRVGLWLGFGVTFGIALGLVVCVGVLFIINIVLLGIL